MIEISPNTLLDTQRLIKKFGELSAEMESAATEAAGKYVLNVLIRNEIPAYRKVTRKEAYPPTGWQSVKQRKYVMAAIRSGEIKIPYPRRSPRAGLAAGWKMIANGKELRLVNDEPHADLVYGEDQPRLLNLKGWRRASTILEVYQDKANDAAIRAIIKLIKIKGLD